MSDIFAEPALYDAAHWWKTDDIDFIADWADRVGSPILELAAGTGRLAIAILDRGHTYTGLDLSFQYVAYAEKKLKKYGDRAAVIQGDMRNFALGKRFEFIFIAFNSFLHLLTDEDALSCLRSVRRHLTNSGRFLVDVFVPDPAFLYRDQDGLYPVMEFNHPDGGHCIVREKNEYDAETEINHIWWYFCRDGDEEPQVCEYDLRMYHPDSMDRLIADAGLTIEQKIGDHDSSALDELSRLQIYVCGK